MSELDRILKLASHGTADAQSPAPAERELKEAPGRELKPHAKLALEDWCKRWSKYKGMNGDPLPMGMVLAKVDAGITTDGIEAGEADKAMEIIYPGKGAEMKSDMNDGDSHAHDVDWGDYEIQKHLPITNKMQDEFIAIMGNDDESTMQGVYDIVKSACMEPTTEAVGEFAEPIYDLIDMHFEGDCQPVFDDLVRFLSGDQIEEFVADFRRHHELPMGDDMDEENINELNVPQSKEKVKAQIKKLMDMADKARADGDPNRAYSIERSSEMLALQKKLSKLGEAQQLNASEYKCEDCGDTMHNPTTDCGHDCDDETGSWWKDKDGNGVPDALEEAPNEGNEFSGELAKAKASGKKEFEVDGKKYKVESEESDTDAEEISEAPTMDTTQLINLMKNSGLSEEKIKTKLDEWANTPAGAAEEEATSHGEPYENFAQSVNLSLKRYLDAEDMKVGLKEHKVEDIKEAYKRSKGEK
jgi:hypothetical protein